MGKFITMDCADGRDFDVYVAQPKNADAPAIVLCQEIFGVNSYMRQMADLYAEEGYLVYVPDLFWRHGRRIELGSTKEDFEKAIEILQKFDIGAGIADIVATVDAARSHTGKVAIIGYCLGGKLALLAASATPVDAAVSYYGVGLDEELPNFRDLECDVVLHIAEEDHYCPPSTQDKLLNELGPKANFRVHVYPGMDHAFARPESQTYNKHWAELAHDRTIEVLRRSIGPNYDLAALWEEHLKHEFETRDVDATMATMVAAPYVNHIPTMTGGTGAKELARFYKYHFIPTTPKDTKLIPISRTIGATQIVDEQLFCFTHDNEIDWMLPGVKPTNRYVEIPLVAIVKFRGDKLWHEHIYWDQASVMVQVGLIDASGLPTSGVSTARKLVDEHQPSNTLMEKWSTSEGK